MRDKIFIALWKTIMPKEESPQGTPNTKKKKRVSKTAKELQEAKKIEEENDKTTEETKKEEPKEDPEPENVVDADQLLEGNEEVLKNIKGPRISLGEDEDKLKSKKLKKRKSLVGLQVWFFVFSKRKKKKMEKKLCMFFRPFFERVFHFRNHQIL